MKTKTKIRNELLLGVLLGMLLSIFGNILVTSMYRLIPTNTKMDAITFILGVVFSIIIGWLLYVASTKN